jgi:hypothetical protein
MIEDMAAADLRRAGGLVEHRQVWHGSSDQKRPGVMYRAESLRYRCSGKIPATSACRQRLFIHWPDHIYGSSGEREP